MMEAEREREPTHQCCCVVIHWPGSSREYEVPCGYQLPMDVPFCGDCEGRHRRMVIAEDHPIKITEVLRTKE